MPTGFNVDAFPTTSTTSVVVKVVTPTTTTVAPTTTLAEGQVPVSTTLVETEAGSVMLTASDAPYVVTAGDPETASVVIPPMQSGPPDASATAPNLDTPSIVLGDPGGILPGEAVSLASQWYPTGTYFRLSDECWAAMGEGESLTLADFAEAKGLCTVRVFEATGVTLINHVMHVNATLDDGVTFSYVTSTSFATA